MCYMTACPDDSTHFAVIKIGPTPIARAGTKRLELCETHYALARNLAKASLTNIGDHGPLVGSRFRPHPPVWPNYVDNPEGV